MVFIQARYMVGVFQCVTGLQPIECVILVLQLWLLVTAEHQR